MSDIKSWKRQKVRLSDVKPMPLNPRTIETVNLAALKESMARFGYVEPIVYNKRTGHIVGGHQRYSVLSAEGVQEATMVVVDLAEDEEMAANITLNNPEIEGEWDDTATDLMAKVESSAPDLFGALRIGELKDYVEKMQPRQSEDNYHDKNEEVDIGDMAKEFDTTCPCCGFGWKIDADDVSVPGQAAPGVDASAEAEVQEEAEEEDVQAQVSVQVEEDRPRKGKKARS